MQAAKRARLAGVWEADLTACNVCGALGSDPDGRVEEIVLVAALLRTALFPVPALPFDRPRPPLAALRCFCGKPTARMHARKTQQKIAQGVMSGSALPYTPPRSRRLAPRGPMASQPAHRLWDAHSPRHRTHQEPRPQLPAHAPALRLGGMRQGTCAAILRRRQFCSAGALPVQRRVCAQQAVHARGSVCARRAVARGAAPGDSGSGGRTGRLRSPYAGGDAPAPARARAPERTGQPPRTQRSQDRRAHACLRRGVAAGAGHARTHARSSRRARARARGETPPARASGRPHAACGARSRRAAPPRASPRHCARPPQPHPPPRAPCPSVRHVAVKSLFRGNPETPHELFPSSCQRSLGDGRRRVLGRRGGGHARADTAGARAGAAGQGQSSRLPAGRRDRRAPHHACGS